MSVDIIALQVGVRVPRCCRESLAAKTDPHPQNGQTAWCRHCLRDLEVINGRWEDADLYARDPTHPEYRRGT